MNKRHLAIAAIVAIGLVSVVNSLILVRQSTGAAWLAAPSIPPLISYQGRLTDAAGTPLTGDHDIRFCLYPDAESSQDSALWCETHAAVNGTAVLVTQGVFNVLLGSIVPIPKERFDSPDLYLGVKVEGDDEMTPRRRVVSVGYAYRAESAVDADTVDGMHASDFATASHTHEIPPGIPSGLVAVFDGSSCPTGWTRVAELDGKFLVGGSSYSPSAGGSNTHTHTIPSHSHGFAAMSENPDSSGTSNAWNAPPAWDKPGSGSGAANFGDHQHNVSGTTSSWSGATDSADNRPEFATVLLCKKN